MCIRDRARRVADELSRISAGACANARLLDVSEAILDVLTQMNGQGMAIDNHPEGSTLEEMELSDLSETMAPDMRQIPLVPEKVEPIADADKRKPGTRRESTKGLFKKDLDVYKRQRVARSWVSIPLRSMATRTRLQMPRTC